MTTATLREVYCRTIGCKMQHKPIGETNGTEARLYCSSCRRWTWWRA